MGPKAFRSQAPQRALRPATYWRRRFLALVAGFGVLSLVAWAFSGALAVGTAAGTGTGRSPGTAPRTAPGTAPGQRPGSRTPAARASTRPAATASPGGASPGLASPAASASGPASPPAGVPARGAGSRAGVVTSPQTALRRACRPADVVLSLFSSQDSYGPGQLPAFDVDVVSTSPGTCTFNVGPKFLTLVITSGRHRIWSSADCVTGAGSLVTDLVKGVPAVLPISWGRETSAPGCFAPAGRAQAGSYRAAASHGGLVSRRVMFRIS